MTKLDRAKEKASYALQRLLTDRIASGDTQIHINDPMTYAALDAMSEYAWTQIEADLEQAKADVAAEGVQR